MISRSDSWAFMIVNIAARAMDLINKSNDRVHSSASSVSCGGRPHQAYRSCLISGVKINKHQPGRLSLIMCRLKAPTSA
jgi:hypothetical protein